MVQVQVCASFFWYKVSLWLSQEETRGSSFASNEQLLRIWMEASFIEASNWGFVFLLALALSHSSLFLLGFIVLLHYYYISFLGAFFSLFISVICYLYEATVKNSYVFCFTYVK